MAVAFVGGAALGAVFGELLKTVVDEVKQTARFKSLLKRLEKTLKSIKPVFQEITKLSKVLDRPDQETEMFICYLEYGKELVLKCSGIKFWNVWDKYIHTKKLIRLDDELTRFFHIQVQANIASNSMKSLIGIYDLADKMDQVLTAVTSRAGGFSGLCSVPGRPERFIGFDGHLSEVKSMLLKDDTRVVVVSAPGGCGKTTLAKMLCNDEEIKGRFGDNILYVTVSRPSSIKTIAQKLFEHHGKNQCEFLTDEEAKNHIESLMRQVGSDKMLLVLDDVWSESESLIQDLNFQIPGYRILVTSRSLFPRFKSTTYELTLLNAKDANTLFCYSAFPADGIPFNVPADLVSELVKFCKGLPLALTVVGASLCGQPAVNWKSTLKKLSDGQSILKSNSSLLISLQTSIDALDELRLKECFLDLGSFPEDDRVAGTVLMDMWVEMYDLDDEGMYASEYLLGLSLRNLVSLVPIRKETSEIEGYCSEHYVTQHDLLRELAIHLSGQEPEAARKRLFMEIHENDFPTWWTQQAGQPINARLLSISTDEAFISTWYDLNAPNVEVLILNTRSKIYALPDFIKRMSQLKVLIVTGYGVYPTQLHNLQFLGFLNNLRRIRFEHVSVSPSIQVIFALQNLKKLSFVTCEIGNALKSGTTGYPYMLPNLIDVEIDRCYDLKELPEWLCSLVRLQKLSITNCHEVDHLPKGLGSLSNLQSLGVHCCTKLQELPESIGNMHDLRLIDISDCLSMSALPEQIGELSGLRALKMSGCRGLQELPMSVSKLSLLEDVICDEETSYLWNYIGSDLGNVNINLVEEDRLGSFRKICQ